MIWTEWGKLKEVVVGKVYDPDEVESDFLKKVLEETEEDFQVLNKIFKDAGAKVRRPDNVSLNEIKTNQWATKYPLPAICPRDFHIVYGNNILSTIGGDPNRYLESLFFYNIMNEKANEGRNYISMPKPLLPNHYANYADHDNMPLYHAANIIKCGNTLIHSRPHDTQEYADRPINQKGRGTNAGFNWVKKNIGYDVNWAEVPAAGHVDGKMALLKPGLLMIHDESLVPKEMQDWDRIVVDKHELPQHVKNRIRNDFYNEVIMKDMPHWVGFEYLPMETIFDVNVVSIDENTVITNGYNKEIFNKCKKYGIECIPFDFRHRFFWDCGIHCITLDLARDDKMENFLS